MLIAAQQKLELHSQETPIDKHMLNIIVSSIIINQCDGHHTGWIDLSFLLSTEKGHQRN